MQSGPRAILDHSYRCARTFEIATLSQLIWFAGPVVTNQFKIDGRDVVKLFSYFNPLVDVFVEGTHSCTDAVTLSIILVW